MRKLAIALLVAAAAFDGAAARRATLEIDNVAAFARLYGVVRYFYPSDAAASLDWNRLAVYGVAQTRGAADPKQLAAALKAIFTPLGPGIVIGAVLPPARAATSPDPALITWRYLGAGIGASTVSGPYQAKRTHRPRVTKGVNLGGADAEIFDAPILTPEAHVELDLGSGLKARIIRGLSEPDATANDRSPQAIAALRAALASIPDADSSADLRSAPTLDRRLADVVAAWNVFRHFYPYWTEAGVDWDARRPTLLAQRIRSRSVDAHQQDRRTVRTIRGMGQRGLEPAAKVAASAEQHRPNCLPDRRPGNQLRGVVMGYVADRKLGTIVGSTTAGTNGNVAIANLPGGCNLVFTGMRVTRHDGRSPFHLIGVQADISILPTISGLRQGKDEVLEQGLERVRR